MEWIKRQTFISPFLPLLKPEKESDMKKTHSLAPKKTTLSRFDNISNLKKLTNGFEI